MTCNQKSVKNISLAFLLWEDMKDSLYSPIGCKYHSILLIMMSRIRKFPTKDSIPKYLMEDGAIINWLRK